MFIRFHPGLEDEFLINLALIQGKDIIVNSNVRRVNDVHD